MTSHLMLSGVAVCCLAACGCPPPQAQRFVPASTVVRMEPRPITRGQFQEAEQQGYPVDATGRGVAFDAWDQPIQMEEGEALHVLRVDPESGEVLACRRDDGKLVRLSLDGLEVEGTTYGRRNLRPEACSRAGVLQCTRFAAQRRAAIHSTAGKRMDGDVR